MKTVAKIRTMLYIAMLISWTMTFAVFAIWFFAFPQILEQFGRNLGIFISLELILAANLASGLIMYFHILKKERAEIVARLREDHRKIRMLFAEIAAITITERTAASVEDDLLALKKLLTDHLSQEDDCFYPMFTKTMKKEEQEVYQLQAFIDQMEIISEDVIGFFEKYASSNLIFKEKQQFKLDLAEIQKTLKDRMEEEENTVYVYWDLTVA